MNTFAEQWQKVPQNNKKNQKNNKPERKNTSAEPTVEIKKRNTNNS